MREILFRGFTPDENGRETITVNGKQIRGEWVQGSYWELRETTYCFQSDYDRHPDNTKHYIVFDRMTDWGLPNRHLQADVIPETVGQFTGLVVKSKPLFEHDIISVQLNGEEVYRFSIAFGNCGGVSNVKHPVGYMGFYFEPANNETRRCVKFGLRCDPVHFINDNDYECEVIGNIHDNPELLETA